MRGMDDAFGFALRPRPASVKLPRLSVVLEVRVEQ
jgi:hypothetical protein